MYKKLQNLFRYLKEESKEGQSLVEYGLILALVAVVSITVLNTMGTQVRNTITSVNTSLQQAQNDSNANAP